MLLDPLHHLFVYAKKLPIQKLVMVQSHRQNEVFHLQVDPEGILERKVLEVLGGNCNNTFWEVDIA